MLLNIKSYIRKPEVGELFSYAVFPDDQSVEKAVQAYESNEAWQLYGYEDGELLVGMVGYEKVGNDIILHHVSVIPENRGLGYGRGMILEMMSKENPERVIVETDEEAVDFYRSIGFIVESLGELYPGTERFRCVYEVEDEAEEM
ncbi:GNAT family N-acetyltransferase [Paenibacillus sp.]|jgi:ribosomal protein S18 acetylase RimI-like enzyme|uniref:GNAT family N-acetyltransferase n=1 Tax=Paenibacillus sp. TaxID=58172 RepID=UPI00282BEBE3|nr:GNAT family N-acetyltransferase [Paenibacillus sp.]MDR0268405.1 GNAT family N-acetyltransferase [Paenibacillus sp.]